MGELSRIVELSSGAYPHDAGDGYLGLRFDACAGIIQVRGRIQPEASTDFKYVIMQSSGSEAPSVRSLRGSVPREEGLGDGEPYRWLEATEIGRLRIAVIAPPLTHR